MVTGHEWQIVLRQHLSRRCHYSSSSLLDRGTTVESLVLAFLLSVPKLGDRVLQHHRVLVLSSIPATLDVVKLRDSDRYGIGKDAKQ